MSTATANRDITDAILKITGLHKAVPVYYVNATVESVDIPSRTCVVTAVDGNVEFEIPGVMLMAVVDDGILIEPVVGSTVKVIYSQNVEPFVCQYSEVANITLTATTLIKLNDGSYGGLIRIADLTEKNNNLVSQVQSELTKIATGIASAGGTYTPGTLSTFNQSDYENTNVKHGN